jgi:Tol biopolymer transport system component
VLPETFVSDPARLARFQREAQILASLNHPNIAHVYGLEEADGTTALVMELVEGPTLADRIAEGAIPVEEALPIARQVAAALEAAHEQGIIHRDLKPANITVRSDGVVKVLDFGLAKALEPATSGVDATASPTITTPAMTRAGMILGTAAYMSPEQARGRRVDKRADIWAFGCVLYEMLTGRPAFDGADVVDTLGSVVKIEPDWTKLPSGCPAGVRRLLARCLVKDPRMRQRDVGDIVLDLEEASQETVTAPRVAPARRVGASLPWLLAAASAAALVALLVRDANPTSGVGHGTRRFTLDLPWQDMPNWGDFRVRISPQGTYLAYPGSDDNRTTIGFRSLDSLTAVTLVGRGADPWNLAFSPDGQRLAFFSGDRLQTVSTTGGRPESIAEIPFFVEGISWSPDGNILAAGRRGLVRVPASGGAVELVAAAGENGYYVQPFHLPNGTHALMSIVRAPNVFRVAVMDLMIGDVRELGLQGVEPIYSPTGHLHFRQGRDVFAVPFDLETLEVRGQAIALATGVAYGPHLSQDGTLVYVAERAGGSARLVWVDRRGVTSPIPGERRDYTHIDLGRNGASALLNIQGEISAEIYASDLNRASRNLVANGGFPVWHPDGERAAFHDYIRDAIVLKKADGTGADEILFEGVPTVPTSWSPDGRYLAFFDRQSDAFILPSGGKATPLLTGPANERSARFSPDGRALAYVSDETGEFQVYVTPFPGAGSKTVVSIDGGLEPLWSSDGSELYFRQGSRVMAARVKLGPPIDVSPDGRFLMVENSEDFQVVIVEGFFQELQRLVPTN